MKDMKIKHNVTVSSKPSNGYYPSTQLSSKHLPKLAKMKDGDHAHLHIKVKKTGSHSDNNNSMAHLDITHAEMMDEPEDKDNPSPAEEAAEGEKE